jgi:nucleoside-diphosphate-sugar epimerase
MINLFGKGYIGSRFAELYQCKINDKTDLIPKLTDCTDLLYLISTVDNYNVKTNPYIDIETNLTTLIRVLENFRQNHKSSDIVFNFASSWFVYGDTELPAKETSSCNPKGFYSITKRSAEQLLISYCETFNLQYRILRFANVLGSNDNKTGKKKNALTYLINELKANNPIQLYDDGNILRDYIHIDDLCRAIKLIIDNGRVNEIYNIGNNIPHNLNDIVKYIQQYGSTSSIEFIKTPEFHKIVQVKNMYMDSSKLFSLGYTPTYTIDQILDELYFSK